MNSPVALDVLTQLDALAPVNDAENRWPAQAWDLLARAGVLGWSIPTEHGGAGRPQAELLDGYLALAGACMTTAFILSQREAAVRRLVDLGSPALQRELLRPLACGGRFATVGLSQLTTSRQHSGPALTARLTAEALHLDGVIPWVTGAAEAAHVVIGAVLDDGRQVLAVLPTDLPGVRIGAPLDLMALQGSQTAELRCEQVTLERRWLLAGPAERVMAGGERRHRRPGNLVPGPGPGAGGHPASRSRRPGSSRVATDREQAGPILRAPAAANA